ncbi:MAG TPA: photosystem reaction center subunit H, partial [Desulfobacteria bacterium]|nr:photosystem reaction center subunit H [Desulfobacteria bacterium]
VSVQEDFKVEAEPVSEQGTAYENTGEEKAAFNSFEQRQIEFMIGKTVDQDVTLDNGEVIPAGEVITAELAQKVTSRKTLMEVSVHLNNQLTND